MKLILAQRFLIKWNQLLLAQEKTKASVGLRDFTYRAYYQPFMAYKKMPWFNMTFDELLNFMDTPEFITVRRISAWYDDKKYERNVCIHIYDIPAYFYNCHSSQSTYQWLESFAHDQLLERLQYISYIYDKDALSYLIKRLYSLDPYESMRHRIQPFKYELLETVAKRQWHPKNIDFENE